MIHLEYDVKTAGIRVSFVIKDGEISLQIPENWEGTTGSGSKRVVPQTANNLKILQGMLDRAKAQEARDSNTKKRRISGDLTPSGGDFLSDE